MNAKYFFFLLKGCFLLKSLNAFYLVALFFFFFINNLVALFDYIYIYIYIYIYKLFKGITNILIPLNTNLGVPLVTFNPIGPILSILSYNM
jgi:hypothetical protein